MHGLELFGQTVSCNVYVLGVLGWFRVLHEPMSGESIAFSTFTAVYGQVGQLAQHEIEKKGGREGRCH